MTRSWTQLLATAAVCLSLGFVTGTAAQSGRRYIDPSTPSATARPFSGGVLVGDVFYVSGTLGLGPNQQVPESPEVEARTVLDNVQNTLKQAGMTMDDLVSVQIFCSDVAHYDVFNRVYRTYFKQEFPARAFIGSGKLLFGARFEVQATAVKRR